ncbi:SNF5-domain-containing protein [Phellopilus nigrolimitatus]|nr:SNF5-domain-containing protein [Phellopilus nigrolimitatus]
MAPQPPPGSSVFMLTDMQSSSSADSQLKSTLNSLSNAASQLPYSPRPASATKSGMFEAKQWSAATFEAKQWAGSTTPAKTAPRPTRNRTTRGTPAASTPTPVPGYMQNNNYAQQTQQASRSSVVPPPPNPSALQIPRPPIPTTLQALTTTYPSRLRTGSTLLMQPILASASTANTGTGRTGTRRGGFINYAEPDSADEIEPDAGERERDSDDSDFVASGGTRTAIRTTRGRTTGGANGFLQYSFSNGSPAPQTAHGKHELDQSYLGLVPPSKFITTKRAEPTKHDYHSQEALENQALKPVAPVPVRVEFETDTHRIRDCFMWDLNDDLIKPEAFARIFCADLDLPAVPWVETVTNQIRAQLEEYEGIASMDLGSGVDGYAKEDADDTIDVDVPECRVILSIDVQIATHHLMDHIEWDLLSPLTPEAFAQQLCADIGLTGEAAPLIAHALHEEILKHKKDAIEWGVIGGETISSRDVLDDSAVDREKREKGGLKDKTGLGLGPGSWGRAPRDGLGRGPRALKSVWKDWNDAEEYATRFEVLTAEEVERREVERERASRRLRRETSKFQFSATRRRR